MNDWPFVAILIPMRNEHRFIATCLDSVLANDYPKAHVEVLVIDGMSTDDSKEIVEAYRQRHSHIRLLSSPKRLQVAALNIGLRQARGEYVVRMDAHTRYASDYVRKCVELLQTTDADNVGGVQRAIGTTYVSRAVAVAITTPFGTGDAYFRYARRQMWVDTVYLGAWRRATLEALGGFDESWAVNEDYELNYRLRRAGALATARSVCPRHRSARVDRAPAVPAGLGCGDSCPLRRRHLPGDGHQWVPPRTSVPSRAPSSLRHDSSELGLRIPRRTHSMGDPATDTVRGRQG